MLRYISHLDMNRVFSRLIRRTDIPVWYTEGFNPHVKLNFALPLSLGFESTSEMVDIRIDDDSYPCESVLSELRLVMPDGLEVREVSDPVKKTSEIAFARFELFTDDEVDLDGFMSQDSITVDKKAKSGVKPTDIKPMIKQWEVLPGKIVLVLSAGSVNLNPNLVIEWAERFIGKPILIKKIVRTNVYDGQMNDFR